MHYKLKKILYFNIFLVQILVNIDRRDIMKDASINKKISIVAFLMIVCVLTILTSKIYLLITIAIFSMIILCIILLNLIVQREKSHIKNL